MYIDHICYAVKDLEEGISYWKNIFGYREMTKSIVNTRQKVKVVFLCKEESLTVKLIEPTAENKSLASFVKYGGGFHHIAFKCDDLKTTISKLTEKNVKLLVPPQPGEAFNNKDIAFFLGKYQTTFELIDTDEKAGLL
jgi:methylmalonyl-CoA/ethylmalonyl-CoA epimerase